MSDTSSQAVWHAHCGCQLTLDRDTGEPDTFVVQCEIHQSAVPGDIAAESRAMTIARMAIAAQADTDINQIIAVMQGDYGSRTAHAQSADGAWVSDVSPLTLEQYISANGQAASYAKAV
jgi:hypothetical protein